MKFRDMASVNDNFNILFVSLKTNRSEFNNICWNIVYRTIICIVRMVNEQMK